MNILQNIILNVKIILNYSTLVHLPVPTLFTGTLSACADNNELGECQGKGACGDYVSRVLFCPVTCGACDEFDEAVGLLEIWKPKY